MAISRYLHARYDLLLKSPVLAAVRRTFEHRQWPIHDDDALVNFGNEETDFLLDHFASLTCMATINTTELKL